MSDYEILELKETRMVLKNASSERSIKIGGGRETPVRAQQPREAAEEQQPHQKASRVSGSSACRSGWTKDARRRRSAAAAAAAADGPAP